MRKLYELQNLDIKKPLTTSSSLAHPT